MQLAVIVPTLNEKAALGATLDSLLAQRDQLDQLVVVDGGSSDGTPELAEQRGVRVIAAPRAGRGCQIAAAVREIDAPLVLVVHADMIVPRGALALVRARLAADINCPGGCLGHRFDSRRGVLRLTEWWDARRGRRGLSYGDQAQFFRRDLLQSQGGFPDQPIMEDVELCRRLKRLGRLAYLDCPVTVSARRFERAGWLRTICLNACLRAAYRLFGLAACQAIYRHYYPVSPSEKPAAGRA